MKNQVKYDIIIIGCGSAGLSVGLFMIKAGFKVLMISKTDHDIGGDCLNDGCVPSKALIHVAQIVHDAKLAEGFGFKVTGETDFSKIMQYVRDKQSVIRKHENATWLREQGVDVALGLASFSAPDEVLVNDKKYKAKKIVIATGSRPAKLTVKGIELVKYLDNESVFHVKELPKRLLIAGGGPIGIEMAQVMNRLGVDVTVVHQNPMILNHDHPECAAILLERLRDEGIKFFLNAHVDRFSTVTEVSSDHSETTAESVFPNVAEILKQDGSTHKISVDTVFAAIGRYVDVSALKVENAGIRMADGRIVTDSYLRTTNKNIFVCGDVAGDLQFSHAAEFHARLILNNLFSPFRKKLDNKNMSWVTFTDPQVASFGFSRKQLEERDITYETIDQSFESDDRAVVGDYRYGRLILYLSRSSWLKKQKILGGCMVAPGAGEMVQELILTNTSNLSINAIFNKIYPYPVASRINQQAIVSVKEKSLTPTINKLLRLVFRVFA